MGIVVSDAETEFTCRARGQNLRAVRNGIPFDAPVTTAALPASYVVGMTSSSRIALSEKGILV
jgi:hypothetical protein